MVDATIVTDAAFSGDEIDALTAIVGSMIPAESESGLPSAADPRILSEILDALAPHAAEIVQLLGADPAVGFAACSEPERLDRLQRLPGVRPAGMSVLAHAVVQAYYRDARVLRALGAPARPPFPGGYDVEAGDWSLLDPVRARPKMFR